jgi:hypothetical protein
MSQPTAPPTPPQQQQQTGKTSNARSVRSSTNLLHLTTSGPPQATQQFVQITQSGMQAPSAVASGNPRPTYRHPGQGPRRQQMINQNNQWQITSMPNMLPANIQWVRAPPNYQYGVPTFGYNPQHFHATAAYGQMPVASQQRQAPQSVAPAPMAQPASSSEYTFAPMEMYPQAMPTPVNPAPQPTSTHQKTAAPKKTASKAITIINPNTGKSIFEEDSTLNASSSASSTAASTASSQQGATAEKTASATHAGDGSKIEAVEDKTSVTNLEPSTPVVSAMTDGPSVDITPKHQVHKMKKM